MIRIYVTETGIEGYHEGCGCCSSTESASLSDIKTLIQKLEQQKATLSFLAEMLEDYDENTIVYWYKEFESMRKLKMYIEDGNAYALDNSIEGTHYKQCYENMDENKKNLELLLKSYKKFPSIFKKYVKEIYK